MLRFYAVMTLATACLAQYLHHSLPQATLQQPFTITSAPIYENNCPPQSLILSAEIVYSGMLGYKGILLYLMLS